MSIADRDRVVFEQYADELGRELSGVWRRERARCVVGRAARGLLLGYARAGLSMVGISPASIQPRAKVPPSGE
jgi:adenine/guanine phosphoribosyltransferase-like PRPP-binding protein